MAGEAGAMKAAWAAVTTAVAEERSWNSRKLPLSVGVNDHHFCILCTLKYIAVEICTILCSRCVFLGLILDFMVPALHFKDFFRPYLYSFLR